MLYYIALMTPLQLRPPRFKTDAEKLENIPAGATTMFQSENLTWNEGHVQLFYSRKNRSNLIYLLVFPQRENFWW